MTIRIVSPSVVSLLLIGGINVWLLTVIAADMVSNDNAIVGKAEWKPSISVLVPGSTSRKPIGAYNQILVQPIFFKTRKPFQAPPAPPTPLMASPPVVDPGFVLAGVMIRSNIKKAYMLSRGNAGGIWASEGDDLMGWKVRAVEEATVRLEQNGRVIEVQLYPRK